MMNAKRILWWVAIGSLVLVGCSNMEKQPKLADPYAPSKLFTSAARQPVAEAVPISDMSDNAAFSTGKVNGELVTTIPVEVTKEMLLAGQRTFNNFCAMCHGYGGNGDGSVARKGMPAVSLHSPELRAAPVGYFFDVITNGKGKMLHLATQIQPYQRWTVVAYLRALQLSQYAALDKLPADLQAGVAAVDR